MPHTKLKISPIPAFQDNYIWLLEAGGKTCAVVDPGDADPVLEVLEARGLTLSHILLTHHHHDHAGGVSALLEEYPAKVFGPADERIPVVHRICSQGDEIHLPDLGTRFRVLEVPAHTRSHIAFYTHDILFCGDTLFSLGCGRLFEGTPADMQTALDKLAVLPPETRVYCAHEYTQSNCAFALAVEPENTLLQARSREIDRLRAAGEITLPSRLGDELAMNPFLRTRADGVVRKAREIEPKTMPGVETMAVIRAWKDRF
jgi:hydroxyacylglutathione hydrolase